MKGWWRKERKGNGGERKSERMVEERERGEVRKRETRMKPDTDLTQ